MPLSGHNGIAANVLRPPVKCFHLIGRKERPAGFIFLEKNPANAMVVEAQKQEKASGGE